MYEGLPGQGQNVLAIGDEWMVVDDAAAEAVRKHLAGIETALVGGTPVTLVLAAGKPELGARRWLKRWRRAKGELAAIEEEVL